MEHWFYVGMAPSGPVVLGPYRYQEQADLDGQAKCVSGWSVRAQDIFSALWDTFNGPGDPQ